MSRVVRVARPWALLGALGMAACVFNPQPEPPGEEGTFGTSAGSGVNTEDTACGSDQGGGGSGAGGSGQGGCADVREGQGGR